MRYWRVGDRLLMNDRGSTDAGPCEVEITDRLAPGRFFVRRLDADQRPGLLNDHIPVHGADLYPVTAEARAYLQALMDLTLYDLETRNMATAESLRITEERRPGHVEARDRLDAARPRTRLNAYG